MHFWFWELKDLRTWTSSETGFSRSELKHFFIGDYRTILKQVFRGMNLWSRFLEVWSMSGVQKRRLASRTCFESRNTCFSIHWIFGDSLGASRSFHPLPNTRKKSTTCKTSNLSPVIDSNLRAEQSVFTGSRLARVCKVRRQDGHYRWCARQAWPVPNLRKRGSSISRTVDSSLCLWDA